MNHEYSVAVASSLVAVVGLGLLGTATATCLAGSSVSSATAQVSATHHVPVAGHVVAIGQASTENDAQVPTPKIGTTSMAASGEPNHCTSWADVVCHAATVWDTFWQKKVKGSWVDRALTASHAFLDSKVYANLGIAKHVWDFAFGMVIGVPKWLGSVITIPKVFWNWGYKEATDFGRDPLGKLSFRLKQLAGVVLPGLTKEGRQFYKDVWGLGKGFVGRCLSHPTQAGICTTELMLDSFFGAKVAAKLYTTGTPLRGFGMKIHNALKSSRIGQYYARVVPATPFVLRAVRQRIISTFRRIGAAALHRLAPTTSRTWANQPRALQAPNAILPQTIGMYSPGP